jgi:phosphatidylglycerol:prolipoprotein diacylglycerol transferase
VLLALIMCIWYMRRNNMPILRTCDVFAPGLALGHALGRLGCFAAGCCYGRETHVPWAVTFHNPLAAEIVGTPLNVPLHPTQLYEMIVELANCVFLVWLIKRKKFEGEILGTYLILYGVARYFIEFFRGDPGRGQFIGFMTTTQAISLLLVIGGGLLWMRRAPLPPAAELGGVRAPLPRPAKLAPAVTASVPESMQGAESETAEATKPNSRPLQPR